MDDNSDIFSEYLEEFRNNLTFDSEICPVCGVKTSDTLAVSNSPFIELLNTNSENHARLICDQLNKAGIQFKIYKSIDNTRIDSINYIFKIDVTMKDLNACEKLLDKLKMKEPDQL